MDWNEWRDYFLFNPVTDIEEIIRFWKHSTVSLLSVSVAPSHRYSAVAGHTALKGNKQNLFCFETRDPGLGTDSGYPKFSALTWDSFRSYFLKIVTGQGKS